MLRKLINKMPTVDIRLCEEKGIEIDEARSLNLTISDHDVIVGSNKHGVLATWNGLNPDSPVSPGFVPSDIKGLRRIYYEEERQAHIKDTASYVISLLEAGVDAIALQEVPAKNGEKSYFETYVIELQKEATKKNVAIDFKAFINSYRQTKKPIRNSIEQGYHGFGTAILFKHNAFSLQEVTELYDGRGASYSLFSHKSSELIQVINIHGDYNKANQLIEFIADVSKAPNTILLSDTNISLDKKMIVTLFSNISGVAIEPSMNVKETADDKRTLDCYVTNIDTNYIYKAGCKNYARERKDLSYESKVFANKIPAEETIKNNVTTFRM